MEIGQKIREIKTRRLKYNKAERITEIQIDRKMMEKQYVWMLASIYK
jgi:hypothetical protein